MSKRNVVALGLAVATATTLAIAGPANADDSSSATAAAACTVRHGKSTWADSAWVMNVGGCFYVGVRHYYDPVWSTSNYWTSWHGGNGVNHQYFTPDSPVYIKHQTESW